MPHIGTRPLETERLILRRFTLDDAEAMYHNWANDPEVARHMRWDAHQNLDETREVMAGFVAAYAQSDHYHWAITLRETGQAIGTVAIFPGDDGIPEDAWEPAYCIGRAWWGNGYTTEALTAALDYFTAGTGITKLECCHAKENPASGRVMEKCGFRFHHDGAYHRLDDSEVPARFYLYTKETE